MLEIEFLKKTLSCFHHSFIFFFDFSFLDEKTPLLSESFETEVVSMIPNSSFKMNASKIKKIFEDESDFSESEGIKDDGDESARESEDEDEDKLMNAETKLKLQDVDPGSLSQKDERHTFKCVVRNIVLREVQDISSSPIKLKFIIGGHPPIDNRLIQKIFTPFFFFSNHIKRHLGGKIEKGKNGPYFNTKYRKGQGEWRNEEYIKFWKGSYRDLEKEKLTIIVNLFIFL